MKSVLFLAALSTIATATDPSPQILLNYLKNSASYKLNPLTGERTL